MDQIYLIRYEMGINEAKKLCGGSKREDLIVIPRFPSEFEFGFVNNRYNSIASLGFMGGVRTPPLQILLDTQSYLFIAKDSRPFRELAKGETYSFHKSYTETRRVSGSFVGEMRVDVNAGTVTRPFRLAGSIIFTQKAIRVPKDAGNGGLAGLLGILEQSEIITLSERQENLK